MRLLPSVSAGLLFLLASLPAPPQSGPAHAPVGQDRRFIMSLYFPAKPSAPFTATSNTIVVRTLPDQSTITIQNARSVARDNDGRIFQERRYLVPNDGKQQSRVTALEYGDPVAHTYYICNPNSKVCQLQSYCGCVGNSTRQPGLQPDGMTYLTREDLGADTFEGLDVVHSRETYTFYKESVGNTNTILRTIEYWYSPQLDVNVKVVVHDPRDGDETLWLSDLSLSAADPQVFKVPDGYRVVDHRNPTPLQPASGDADQPGQQ